MTERQPLRRARNPAAEEHAVVGQLTRAFLFADLRGYTSFVDTNGASRAADLLTRFRSLVRTAVASSPGAEIRTEGDSFFVVFPSASAALGCALEILRTRDDVTEVSQDPIHVGIGVHAGEAVSLDGDFVGSAVNIAARLAALAASGEILVTETVRSLTRSVIEATFTPRGRRRLKGLADPLALFAVTPLTVRPEAPPLQIELLGHFQISHAGRRIESIRSSRLEALVAYLVLHAGFPLRREQLASLLWPESSDAQALTNLRRELHLLRSALPEPAQVLEVEHRTIQWRTGDQVRVDATNFEAAVGRGRAGDPRAFEEATTLYRGPLLPTCYDDWAVQERERFHGLYIEATEGLVASLEARREYARAMQLLRQLIQLDPLHEPAYQALMRIAALAGNRSAGLQAYHAAVTNLRRELGVEPSPETQAIYGNLLTLDSEAAPALPSVARAAPAPQLPSPAAPGQPLIGRTVEWAAMLDAWGRATTGNSRLLALRGEAGIGKTRLLEELVRWCRAHGQTAVYTRSYAAEGALAYAPIADWLRATPIRSSFDGLGDVWLSELARVLPELLAEKPALPPPAPMAESWQRKRLFEAIGHAVHSAPVPLLLVLDDIQWADDESLEWLHYLLREDTSSGILVAMGIRAEEQHANAALEALLSDMVRRDHLDLLDLHALSESETTALARQVAGDDVEEGALAGLYRETEGHPLYVVELARGGIKPVPDGTGAGAGSTRLPPRMQAVIAARLAQLSEPAREAVDLAATIGRAFTFDLLQHAGDLEEPALVRALDELWQRQVIREQALNAYDFAHDRIREVAYAGIAPPRRRLLHRRVARALELSHADDPDAVSPDLAAQFEAAGLASAAIDWYERAADAAKRLSANGEALNHLQKAIALVGQLPPSSDRDRRELKLQMAAGAPLVAERGYASGEFAEALERVRILAEQCGDEEAVAFALGGLGSAAFVRAEFQLAVDRASRSIALAARHPDLLSGSEATAGGALTALGQIDAANQHFASAIRAYQPGRSRIATGVEPGVFALSWSSHTLWLSGAPDQALERHRQAMELATSHGPHTQALAHAYGAILMHFRGDADAMAERAHAAMDLCERYGFAYYGEWGQMLLAWLDRGGPTQNSVSRIEQALANLRAIGAESRRPYFLSLLAEAHAAAGDRDRARAVLGAALSTSHAHEDVFWLPELHRLLAELGPQADREAGLRRALDLARGQGSRSLALQAAVSLVRLRREAAAELERVLESLPEGESSAADEARRLLGTLPARV